VALHIAASVPLGPFLLEAGYLFSGPGLPGERRGWFSLCGPDHSLSTVIDAGDQFGGQRVDLAKSASDGSERLSLRIPGTVFWQVGQHDDYDSAHQTAPVFLRM
jgi:hypothetical protein